MDTQSEAGVLKREHLYDLVWAGCERSRSDPA